MKKGNMIQAQSFYFENDSINQIIYKIYSWTFTTRMKNNCKIKQSDTAIDIYTCMLCKVQEAREITFHYREKEDSVTFQLDLQKH